MIYRSVQIKRCKFCLLFRLLARFSHAFIVNYKGSNCNFAAVQIQLTTVIPVLYCLLSCPVLLSSVGAYPKRFFGSFWQDVWQYELNLTLFSGKHANAVRTFASLFLYSYAQKENKSLSEMGSFAMMEVEGEMQCCIIGHITLTQQLDVCQKMLWHWSCEFQLMLSTKYI